MRVLRYAEECGARGLLVVPDWPSSTWRPVLDQYIKERTVRVGQVFRPRLVCPEYIRNNTFHGLPKFDFLALLMMF